MDSKGRIEECGACKNTNVCQMKADKLKFAEKFLKSCRFFEKPKQNT